MASYVGIPSSNPTKYLGPNVALVSVVSRNRSPTGADIRQGSTGQYYPLGSMWIISKDPTTGSEGDMWWLSKIVANVAYWIQIVPTSGDFTGIDTPDGTTVVPTVGVVNFLNGTGSNITGSGSSVTFNVTGGGLAWSEVTETAQQMAINNGYVANNSGVVTLTLPATAAQFSIVTVLGKGSGGWSIAQNAGQTIYFGTSSSTTGIAGSLSSTHQRDEVSLICITANTEWQVLPSPQGNLTVI